MIVSGLLSLIPVHYTTATHPSGFKGRQHNAEHIGHNFLGNDLNTTVDTILGTALDTIVDTILGTASGTFLEIALGITLRLNGS